MVRTLLLINLLLLGSCGGLFKWSNEGDDQRSRQVASLSVQQLMLEDKEGLNEIIDERLQALFSYYLIGQKNLHAFDEILKHRDLDSLYSSTPYMNLVAVRTQTDEIEQELFVIWKEAHKEKELKAKLLAFSGRSRLHRLAMANLADRLGISSELSGEIIRPSKAEIQKEWEKQELFKEFLVYEKNIEHLSHMIDVNKAGDASKFRPSTDRPGNVTGHEFPPKVWALTFNGPATNLSKLLPYLKEHNLKATVFLLAMDLKGKSETLKKARDMGVEIASNSWSHRELTKVGALTLEKEISGAVNELRKEQEIKFFRLPYGAGVNSFHVREKIAANGLIHASWTVDTLDWMAQHPEDIVKRTLHLMKKTDKDSGILLFHDVHGRTVMAAVEIMAHLKKDGRRVCTLDEIVTQMNEGAEKICP